MADFLVVLGVAMNGTEPVAESGDPVGAGVALFNAAEFWHAHERWERLWLVAKDPERRFLQGLIQLAAAYHHVKRGTLRGAVRLFDAALTKLEPYADGYLGVDRTDAITASIVHRRCVMQGDAIEASDYPKLRYNSSTSSIQRNLPL
jgi:predicted metal-dependent hydrolase